MSSDEPVTFSTVRETTREGAVLRVFGQIDFATAAQFEAALIEIAATGTMVTIDLESCRYVDSSGLRMLIRAYKRFGPRVRLLALPDTIVTRVLQIAGFDKIFPMGREP